MEKYEYKNQYRYLTDVMLNVTDDCNLQCKYCFVEQHPHYMTLDTGKAIVDWIVQNRKKRIELGYQCYDKTNMLYFFGGEPMLCYRSIIVPLVEYCKEKYPNQFNFGMTTNGTLLNKEVIDFLYQNNFDLLLSIDGDKKTQDFNRPCRDCHLSSFDLLEKNIPYLLEKFPNICFRSTIYAPTVEHLFENYLYAEKMGFKNYTAIEDARHPWNQEQFNILKQEIAKIYQYILMKIINKQGFVQYTRLNEWLNYTFHLYNDNKTYYNIQNWNSIERCGMATTVGAVGWDGSIYGCQEQVSKDNKTIFYIGNIFNGGIDIEKHNNLLKTYYNYKNSLKQKKLECTNCELNQICKINIIDCPSTMLDNFGTMNDETEIGCQMKKNYFNNSLILLKILTSIDDKEIQSTLIKLLE